MHLKPPTGSLEDTKEMFEHIFYISVSAYYYSENCRRDAVRSGVQTDAFSCAVYVLAYMRATANAAAKLPSFIYPVCNSDPSEGVHQSCEELYMCVILHCAAVESSHSLNHKRVFRSVLHMASSIQYTMSCIELSM